MGERKKMKRDLGFSLTRTAMKYGDRVAIIFKDRVLTYKRLNERVNRFANALSGLGLEKGTKVALLLNNCNELVESIYGILKAGGIVVPINTRLSTQEICFLVNHSDSSTFVFDRVFVEKFEAVRRESDKVQHFIACNDEKFPGVEHYEALLQGGSPEEPKVNHIDENDEAFIIYTAGTTGRPKGVVLTHSNFLWNCVNYCMGGITRPEDYNLQIFPLFHVAGLASALAAIFIGCKTYLKDKIDPEDCLETIQRESINKFGAIPSIGAAVVNLPGIHKFNLDSVKLLGSGGAPMPPEVKRKLSEIFRKAGIYDCYGQTESAGTITALLPKDAFREPASVGQAFFTNIVKVFDDQDRELPPGQVGELVYDGYTRMRQYYKDPEATEEAIRGGWMHSGDLAMMDEEGFFYIVDRKKDMIITGGENVYSIEVEDTIAKMPGIAETGVIGLPDPKWGETVTAVIVLKPGVILDEEEVIRFCKTQIAAYKAPKKVIFAGSLPKSPIGKILKKELKALYGGK